MSKTTRILATVFAVLLAISSAPASDALALQPITDHGSPITSSRKGPSPYDLPGDCAIVAAEAASRLAATGAWVRVVHITFFSRAGEFAGHAITVWQMPGAKAVFVYDEYILGGGSLELDTASHDCAEIVKNFGRQTHTLIFESHFVT